MSKILFSLQPTDGLELLAQSLPVAPEPIPTILFS